ncbi:activator of basal transcription 1-like [Nerophis ophidion]|uniref:activator of basal transcription 1-like n=1 Tax=Nerophis ophidion TaxID=159077 RepID=UPI002ADF52D8|nr:activator of basal transcription 1-like [Nerophis ophidion]
MPAQKEEEDRRSTTQEEEEDRRSTTQDEEEDRKSTTEEEDEDRKQTVEEEEEDMKQTVEEEEEDMKQTVEEEEEDTTIRDDGDAVEIRQKKRTLKGAALTSSSDRKCVPGILYLGHIPPRFRPKHLRNLMSVYGEIGRVFLQPEDGEVKKRKRKAGSRRCDFTEGWVEFRDKRVAKRVAASLHNTPMATRKRQTFTSDLWCIKYLHRFQWTHLSERLAYEQMVLKQRLRTEVSQAKRETNFYLDAVDKSAHMDKVRKRKKDDAQQVEERTWDFTQRQTEEEIQKKKKKRKDAVSQKQQDKDRLHQQKSQSNVSLLAKIFNSQQP